MVALLWAEGLKTAAIELEELWNELAESYAFYLHCAYPSAFFVGLGDVEPLARVCAAHTDFIPPEVHRGPMDTLALSRVMYGF